MKTEKLERGDFVLSLAGRDKGRIHLVIDSSDNFAYIADGKTRKTEKPKLKKLMHLMLLDCPRYSGELKNRQVRAAIKVLADNVK